MEQDMNQSTHPTLCRSGCGFYGSPATDGLCSKCFKESLKRRQASSTCTTTTNSAAPPAAAATGVKDEEPKTDVVTKCSEAVAASDKGETLAATTSNGEVDKPPSPGSVAAVAEDERAPAGSGKGVACDAVSSSGNSLVVSASSSSLSSGAGADSDPGRGGKKATRCGKCKKRVGLTGMECRCGGIFCSLHRYSDTHDCTYDYRAAGAEEIRRNNPVIQSEKIQKF